MARKNAALRNSPRRQKRFLRCLQEEGALPFPRVIELLGEGTAGDRASIPEALNFLWVEHLFTLRREDGEEVWIDDDLFAHPERYTLHLAGFAGKNANIAQVHSNRLRTDTLTRSSPTRCLAEVLHRELLTVLGELDGATLLAERVRAFVQYFAHRLTRRDYDGLAKAVASASMARLTPAFFAARMDAIEAAYGEVEFFDHLHVSSVCNGPCDEADLKGGFALTGGIARDQRRGQASFRLVSVCTPDGAAIHTHTVSVDVIEEMGLLKVCTVEWRAD